MQTFRSFSEEKGVTLTGGGKTVSLKPGQSVSFKHATSGKNVSGTFRKKKMMGGRQYAHVDMPDNTGMYVPVHHINEAVDEGYMHIGPADGSSPYNKFGDKKPGTKTLGNDSKREKRDMEPRSPVKKNINDRLTTTREEVEHIDENVQYKADLPMMMKDLKAKKKGSSDMRREYGSSWKKLCNDCSSEHGSNYTRQHLMSMAQKHMNEEVEQVEESGLSKKTLANYITKASGSTTDKTLSAKKIMNRYAGVHKADKALDTKMKS
jgi:phage baseplate assembly protein W